MAVPRFSIRRQLLLLGALATASIWTGALLQHHELRNQAIELASIREDVASAERFAQAARMTARERGQTYGWLSDSRPIEPGELAAVRANVDAQLAGLAAHEEALPVAVSVSRDDLSRLRGRIDRRDIDPAEVFGFYSKLVAAMQDTGAQRLERSMVTVGLPYEHVNHLQRIAERVAQMRGRGNGALRSGKLTLTTEVALARELALFDESVHLYDRSAPDVAARRIAPALESPAVRTAIGRVRMLLEVHRLDALSPDATTWWSLATEAVDTLARAAAAESLAISDLASQRMDRVERQMRWTVATLFALGVVTLLMVLSTVSRIVSGLDRLLEGLETFAVHRDFHTRIEERGDDEFGRISSGINKLIALAGRAAEGQETLGDADALTGAVNRRGFYLHLDARTCDASGHSLPLALLIIDIDHFKSVNHALGKPQGDLVLKGLARVLRRELRPSDVLGRFGGAEFVALLSGCPLDDAVRVAENLRVAIEAHDFGIGHGITASFGVATWNRGQTASALLADADANLYAAKAAGRNRVMPAVAGPARSGALRPCRDTENPAAAPAESPDRAGPALLPQP